MPTSTTATPQGTHSVSMKTFRNLALLLGLVAAAGCTDAPAAETPMTSAPTSSTSTIQPGPMVNTVTFENDHVAAYDMVEFVVELDAEYENPYDQREIALDAVFTSPSGVVLELPGFWDGEENWKLRFTPNEAGGWTYDVTVTDSRGSGPSLRGSLEVADSDHRGFLRIGDQVDPSYSPRYFAYEDGTAWYGRGHADLDMSLGGAAPGGNGLRKFSEMTAIGENYEMWWPMWGNNFMQETYDDYAPAQMNIIDFVVREAETNGIALVYTIWGHQFLRTPAHDWPDERWNFNGFSELTDIAGFFTDPEAWAWQENYYRYVIARWSYSPAIVMWQTITEINGTEAYAQTDPWHEKVNAYFQDRDPYRHPTTATMSGAVDWPQGHAVMDVPQVHLYHIFGDNPIADGAHFAEWTRRMWDREVKPNWIGEYGNSIQAFYPEFMHNANWTSLAAGSAMTPIEWNDLNEFGRFDDAMREDMARFAEFTDQLPLAVIDPETVEVASSDPDVRGWALAGARGGVFWLQDFALEDATIEEIRADQTVRANVVVTLGDLAAGTWQIRPFDTWSGEWGEPYSVECPRGGCEVIVPAFHRDIALLLER